MATVSVQLGAIDSRWKNACQAAVKDLNALFKQKRVNVVLSTSAASGPTISVRTDPGIVGTAVHGRTTAETSGSGALLRAEVRLPIKVIINTPQGIRDAGPGVLEVIAAHEFVHALGHAEHNSHLMGQTLNKMLGNSPAGDKLQAGGVSMPPLQLAPQSIEQLKALWG
jgi:predicted Zn-dependent protease